MLHPILSLLGFGPWLNLAPSRWQGGSGQIACRGVGRVISVPMMVALFVWVAQDAAAQVEAPAWKFKQGDRFLVSVEKQVQRTAKLNSKITVVESNVDLRFAWSVVEVSADGAAKVEQTLERYSISVGDPAVPRQAISFASDDSPQELAPAIRKLQRRAKPLIGLKSSFSMTAQGEVSDVVLADESKAKLKKLEDSPQVQSLLDEKALQEAMEAFSMNVVPETMEAGKWSRREAKANGAKVQHEFQLNEAVQIKNKKIATIDIESTLVQPTEAAPDDSDKSNVKKNQVLQTVKSLAGAGQIDFDVEAGYFPKSEYVSTVVSERKYREKTITTTVESTTRMKIEKQ